MLITRDNHRLVSFILGLLLLKLLLGVGEVPPVASLGGELGAVHLGHGSELAGSHVPEHKYIRFVFVESNTNSCSASQCHARVDCAGVEIGGSRCESEK